MHVWENGISRFQIHISHINTCAPHQRMAQIIWLNPLILSLCVSRITISTRAMYTSGFSCDTWALRACPTRVKLMGLNEGTERGRDACICSIEINGRKFKCNLLRLIQTKCNQRSLNIIVSFLFRWFSLCNNSNAAEQKKCTYLIRCAHAFCIHNKKQSHTIVYFVLFIYFFEFGRRWRRWSGTKDNGRASSLDYVGMEMQFTRNLVFIPFACVCVWASVIVYKQLDERTQAIPNVANLRNGFALLLHRTLEHYSRCWFSRFSHIGSTEFGVCIIKAYETHGRGRRKCDDANEQLNKHVDIVHKMHTDGLAHADKEVNKRARANIFHFIAAQRRGDYECTHGWWLVIHEMRKISIYEGAEPTEGERELEQKRCDIMTLFIIRERAARGNKITLWTYACI